jgi:hypothetical protein
MSVAEMVNLQEGQGFQSSSICGRGHVEAAPGKVISPAGEPCLTVHHTEQKAEVQRALPGEIHQRNGPAQKAFKGQKTNEAEISITCIAFVKFLVQICHAYIQTVLLFIPFPPKCIIAILH